MWENKTIFMGNASLDSKASFLKLHSFSCNIDMIAGASFGYCALAHETTSNTHVGCSDSTGVI